MYACAFLAVFDRRGSSEINAQTISEIRKMKRDNKHGVDVDQVRDFLEKLAVPTRTLAHYRKAK